MRTGPDAVVIVVPCLILTAWSPGMELSRFVAPPTIVLLTKLQLSVYEVRIERVDVVRDSYRRSNSGWVALRSGGVLQRLFPRVTI